MRVNKCSVFVTGEQTFCEQPGGVDNFFPRVCFYVNQALARPPPRLCTGICTYLSSSSSMYLSLCVCMQQCMYATTMYVCSSVCMLLLLCMYVYVLYTTTVYVYVLYTTMYVCMYTTTIMYVYVYKCVCVCVCVCVQHTASPLPVPLSLAIVQYVYRCVLLQTYYYTMYVCVCMYVCMYTTTLSVCVPLPLCLCVYYCRCVCPLTVCRCMYYTMCMYVYYTMHVCVCILCVQQCYVCMCILHSVRARRPPPAYAVCVGVPVLTQCIHAVSIVEAMRSLCRRYVVCGVMYVSTMSLGQTCFIRHL